MYRSSKALNLLTLAALAGLAMGSAQAVEIKNGLGTVLFYDDFEGAAASTAAFPDTTGDFDPVAITGSWIINEPATSTSQVTSFSPPGAVQGNQYLRSTRTTTGGFNNFANFGLQTSGTLHAEFMYYIVNSAAFTEKPFGSQISMTTSDGPAFPTDYRFLLTNRTASHTIFSYDTSINADVDTGVAYTPNTWQKWVFDVNLDAQTFSFSIEGNSSGNIPFMSPGGATYMNFNSGSNNSQNLVDAVPPAVPTNTVWQINGSGDWNLNGNWTNGRPNSVGAEADFFGAIESAQTVYTNTAVTVGTLNFNNANTYVITGAGSLTMEGTTTAHIVVQQGTQKVNLPLIVASDMDITVSGGATLLISNPMTINANKTVNKTGNVLIEAPLTIEAGGVLNLTPGPAAVLFGAPSLGTDAKIDVKSGAMVLRYGGQMSPIAAVKAAITEGYDNAAWTGSGITSADAAAVAASPAANKTALGYGDNSVLNYVTFGGQSVDAAAVLVRYTYQGDANLDGEIESTDFNMFVAGYGTLAAAVWTQGDFNFDSKVDTLDFNLLAGNFGLTAPAPLLGALVPEPSSLAAICIAGIALCRSRRPGR